MSYLIRGISGNGELRIFVTDTTEVVETAREIHHTTPVVSAALGRSLTASLIMGSMMKGDADKLTLIIKGGGPIEGITCVVNSQGTVKGYAVNPNVELPLKPNGKLDVGGAVGNAGSLTIIRDMGLKEPYAGSYPLVNGEIAEDLTSYLAYSEQQPSAVALGVLVDVDYTIKAAGGMIVQTLPGSSDETLEKLENNLKNISSISHLIEEGKTPEDIMNIVLEGLEPKILDRIPVQFQCDCSREKIEEVFTSLGKKEIEAMIEEDNGAEVVCHFCNTAYKFTKEDLESIGEKL